MSVVPPLAAPRRRHGAPLLHAGKMIASDLVSTLVFVGLYALTGSVLSATVLATAVGLAHVVYLKVRGVEVELIEWVSLALVVILGVASLLTHDPRFVMVKPTLIYLAIGGAMLKRGWMLRYLPTNAGGLVDDVTIGFGYVWALMMVLTAVLNLVVAGGGDPRRWALFVAAFPPLSKAALFGVQYAATRAIGVARRRRSSFMVNARQP